MDDEVVSGSPVGYEVGEVFARQDRGDFRLVGRDRHVSDGQRTGRVLAIGPIMRVFLAKLGLRLVKV